MAGLHPGQFLQKRLLFRRGVFFVGRSSGQVSILVCLTYSIKSDSDGNVKGVMAIRRAIAKSE